MSYILEALKKSEKKRAQDITVSLLDNKHPRPPGRSSERRGKGMLILLAGILAASAAGLSGWYSFKGGDNDNTVPPKMVGNSSTITPSPATTEALAEQPLPELRATKKKQFPETASVAPLHEQPPSSLSIPESSLSHDALIPATADQPPYLEQLPISFQATVPTFKLAGHVFSPEPRLRMIMINNKIVRERESIEKGFVLEEITSNGVILRGGNERFQLRTE